MTILEIKNLERQKYKYLRKHSNFMQKKKVMQNVEAFLESFFSNERQHNYVAIYYPLKDEVDLRDLKKKYSLALPKCLPNKKLGFYIWDENPLKKDLQGIPAPDNNNLLDSDQISLILISCLSIDKRLIRLGYGGGYFDKLRSNKSWRNIPCIGILTSNCVSKDFLSNASWDIPLTGFITDKEIFYNIL